ncbi:MAG: ABC transporter permease [Chloroflexota bacterium]
MSQSRFLMARNLFHYRHYILHNSWLDFRQQYAGSVLGIFWTLLLPLIEVLIYTVVFSKVLGRFSNNPDYILYLCAGLFPWLVFAKSLSSGCNIFRAKSAYLTKLAIPEEVFVAQSALDGVFNFIIYFCLLLVFGLFFEHPFNWIIGLIPLVIILFQTLAFGLTLILASLQVFFKDITEFVRVIINLIRWTLPIMYVEEILPLTIQAILVWHPFYFYIIAFRDLFLDHTFPAITTWGAMIIWTTLAVFMGNWVLQMLKPELRDVL